MVIFMVIKIVSVRVPFLWTKQLVESHVVERHQLATLHNIFVSALSISTIAEFLGSNLLHSQQPLNYVAPTGWNYEEAVDHHLSTALKKVGNVRPFQGLTGQVGKSLRNRYHPLRPIKWCLLIT